MKITYPDKSTETFEGPVPLGELLLKRYDRAELVAGRVDGEVRDLTCMVEHDAELAPVLRASDEGLHVLRHSAAHVMAGVVLDLFPDGKTAIGPAIDTGFYYDFDLPRPLTETDLATIEKAMKKVLKKKHAFTRREMDAAEAAVLFADQPFKLELIEDMAADDPAAVISVYTHDKFTDLCAGPHVPDTRHIPPPGVKLLSTAGAYWRGDEKRPMLQRIYGTAFFSKDDLRAHLDNLAEIERRDHRRLGRELDLFSIHPDIGPGLVLWHPAGATIRREIERFWTDEHLRRGYEIVYTPHIASEKVYEKSGHLSAYKDMMYAPMEIDGVRFRAKPMNCPAHILIFTSTRRSYRELPMRLAELGTVYRYERSGVLHGMLRVRGFTQDDAHIFCSRDQLTQEVHGVLDLFDYAMGLFGYRCKVYLATRPTKYIGAEEEWDFATAALTRALEERNMDFAVDEGGGVFYAPKIDYKIIDVMNREWQGPTCQVDLNLPERFDIDFINTHGSSERAIMIHRTVLGSMERFVGGLIEHFAGAFPLWLAPVQAVVVPITSDQTPYGERVAAEFRGAGLRVKLDARSEKMGYKIREWTLGKVPYILVLGKREEDAGTVSVRTYRGGDQGASSLVDLRNRMIEEVASRAIPEVL